MAPYGFRRQSGAREAGSRTFAPSVVVAHCSPNTAVLPFGARAPIIVCPHCGEAARFVKHRPKARVGLLGLVRYRRAYYHCRDCHAGLTHDRLTPAADEAASLTGAAASATTGSARKPSAAQSAFPWPIPARWMRCSGSSARLEGPEPAGVGPVGPTPASRPVLWVFRERSLETPRKAGLRCLFSDTYRYVHLFVQQ
jgi:hypothetical protein